LGKCIELLSELLGQYKKGQNSFKNLFFLKQDSKLKFLENYKFCSDFSKTSIKKYAIFNNFKDKKTRFKKTRDF